ncbi:MAG: DUF5320 domain-containing protein [Clostridia bacterium]|nr:DUF5320 domain-containing protein [Clostridia bacterium]MDD4571569.1 DUF5320 domain-containing protein [Clostridia bacterium]
MPGRDGTGPTGQGSKTGRGLGNCKSGASRRDGKGLGFGAGFSCRRSGGRNAVTDSSTDKAFKFIGRAKRGFGGKA